MRSDEERAADIRRKREEARKRRKCDQPAIDLNEQINLMSQFESGTLEMADENGFRKTSSIY